jgi:hypothetical protein
MSPARSGAGAGMLGKLLRVNWALVLLVGAIACIGFLML